MQEQAGTEFPRSRHSEYGPHGEGTQGSRGISSSFGTMKLIKMKILLYHLVIKKLLGIAVHSMKGSPV